jgi:hypothetical protein
MHKNVKNANKSKKRARKLCQINCVRNKKNIKKILGCFSDIILPNSLAFLDQKMTKHTTTTIRPPKIVQKFSVFQKSLRIHHHDFV